MLAIEIVLKLIATIATLVTLTTGFTLNLFFEYPENPINSRSNACNDY